MSLSCTETGVPSWWQRPQVAGTFMLATGDRGFLTATIWWGWPWQSKQRGAVASPPAAACSCELAR